MDNLKNHPLYRTYTIDIAFNSLWDFYKNNFAKLFAISLIMAAILQYILTAFDIASIQNETDINILMGKMRELIIPVGILALVNIFFYVIIQHYILFSLSDENSSILDSVLKSLRYFFPYIITIFLFSILGGVAMAFGLVAFIIGAFFAIFYVITLYLFILPIMMMESHDIGYTIIRTFKLTHKNFWSNYGWVIVFLILFLLISFILAGLVLTPFTGNLLNSILNPNEAENFVGITQRPLYIILTTIANAVTMPLMPIFSAILYFNGRAREENKQSHFIGNEEKKVTVEDLYAKPYFDSHHDD